MTLQLDREGQGCQLGTHSNPSVRDMTKHQQHYLPSSPQPQPASHQPGLSSWELLQVTGQDVRALGVGVGHRLSELLSGDMVGYGESLKLCIVGIFGFGAM